VSAAALLDVNVLIALLDPMHVHHESAHQWFAKRGDLAWTSCALTQIADTYLLAFAVRQEARLASFDRRLVTSAVAGGSEALELIPA
jgi:predicted nucleic acid-binding protein